MNDKEKAEKWDRLEDQIESGANQVEINGQTYLLISDEMVRWMTEGTDPRQAPRSDCG